MHSCLNCGFEDEDLGHNCIVFKCLQCTTIQCLVCKKSHEGNCDRHGLGSSAVDHSSNDRARKRVQSMPMASESKNHNKIQCVFCNNFLTSKYFPAHKKTKKHQKNVRDAKKKGSKK